MPLDLAEEGEQKKVVRVDGTGLGALNVSLSRLRYSPLSSYLSSDIYQNARQQQSLSFLAVQRMLLSHVELNHYSVSI